ncbi:MAG: carbamoyltransferase C-terminal domain-containing protein [Candidatus Thorarchaeota archaeon]
MITVGMYGIPDVGNGPHANYTHDHGIALMKDGKVITSIQLERMTGKKHDNRLQNFIGQILENYVPHDEEVRFVNVNSFAGSSLISTDGQFRIEPNSNIGIDKILYPADVKWYSSTNEKKETEGHIMCHEFAHIASILPFVGDFLPNSLLVHIDGGAFKSACSFWYWDGHKPKLLYASWDLLKTQVNNFNVNPLAMAILNQQEWQHLSLPGKLMGYSGLGKYRDDMITWLEGDQWFHGAVGNGVNLIHSINKRWDTDFTGFDARSPFFMDIGASIQKDFERKVTREIFRYREETGAENLYYSGGAALNIPTNRILEVSGKFKNIFIPPATNDSGLALGAAAWIEFLDHGRLDIHSPFLNKFDLTIEEEPLSDMDEIKRMIISEKIIGTVNGYAEIGPRALGHRSLISLANSNEIKVRLSEGVKGREWYRPIAPILCEEAAREVLEGVALGSNLSPFMLGAYELNNGYQEEMKAVLHGNNLVRSQIVKPTDSDNKWAHRLLSELWNEHGIPGLINTSFNGSGEPLIHYPDDAKKAVERLGIDGVVINGSLYLS